MNSYKGYRIEVDNKINACVFCGLSPRAEDDIIQYLDYTWNPIAMRCNAVSDGCANCWHMRMAHRMKHNNILSKKKRAAYAGDDPVFDLTELSRPLRKHNSKIGVQFMGDLFHPNVTDEYIHAVFSIMFDCLSIKQTGNTFFILTKRPARMKEFLTKIDREDGDKYQYDNIWFGVSAENQETADRRIPVLLDSPVKHRWISAEPLLGEIDLREYPNIRCGCGDCWTREGGWPCPTPANKVDWVVCGAETGPGARPMHWEWAISLADQCKAAKAPFFFKEPWSPLTPDGCRIRELPPCDCESCQECRAKGF